jgi:hypothetical protein
LFFKLKRFMIEAEQKRTELHKRNVYTCIMVLH